MGNRIRDLWLSLLSWYTGEPVDYLTCPTNHQFLDSRMKWTEEVVEYYQECVDCGKEFYADD